MPVTDGGALQAYVAVSPNSDFVPAPHLGLVQVYLCKDYRYGVYDPIQWPQVFSEDFQYLCAIRRRNPTDEQTFRKICDSPSNAGDFEALPGVIFKTLGLLSKTWFAPIDQLVHKLAREVQDRAQRTDPHLILLRRTILDARNHILHFPSTFRDVCVQIHTVQQYWLMCRAYLDFERLINRADSDSPLPVDTRFMGAFTTHPAITQRLYHSGIPVWHIRPRVGLDHIVVDAIVVTEQADLVCEPFETNASPVYTGLAVNRRAYLYLDVSRGPLLVRYDQLTFCAGASPTEGPGQRAHTHGQPQGRGRGCANPVRHGARRESAPYNTTHASHLCGRNKFMPLRLHAWDLAMQSVDRSTPAKRSEALWGYWIPEPALLLGPQTIERTHRYLLNWLRIRAAWVYLLSHPDARITRVPPQWWRDYLNGDIEGTTPNDATRRAKHLEQIRSVFSVAFEAHQFVAAPDQLVNWFSFCLSAPPPNLCPFILWEVHEIGFRYELLALDCILVPARDPETDELAHHDLYYVRQLPQKPVGLCADLPHARVRCLEALRQVLSLRGSDPLSLTLSASRIQALEVEMATFYVQTFFAYSGRAPIVPHALPVFREM
ncbi:hypothetical protein C8T65DRAFT_712258 [Cerioporus squamosus]|nr:hypothetical protein C8T65DRAFT_712258 [Cerioporus squamosus]